MYDVIIIGSGPAGLAASIYAKRAGLKALTLEKQPMSGGQVLNTYEVDNYPGLPGINGFDLGMKLREHADKLECEFQTAAVLSINNNKQMQSSALQAAAQKNEAGNQAVFTLKTDQGELTAKTVIAAMGATHAKLNVPGEELAGMGVSYCATCDGAFFRNKTVAVIGGGDVAVEDAIFLARSCEKVYLIHRRDELRAAAVLQNEVKALANVEIIWDTVADKIEGSDQVEALVVKNVKTEKVDTIKLDGVFIAVGIIPISELLKDMGVCNQKGYVIAGEDGATDVPGLFVAGDLRGKKLRQIVTAVADGANAVTSVTEYLINNRGV